MTAAPTMAAALLRLARCSACQMPPEQIEQVVDHSSLDVKIIFRCHGSRQVVTVPERAIRRGDRHGFARAFDQAEDLFADHATPDVIELLRYNRFPWRVTP